MNLFKAARRDNETVADSEEHSHTAEELELIALRSEVERLTNENKRLFEELKASEAEVRRIKAQLAEAGLA